MSQAQNATAVRPAGEASPSVVVSGSRRPSHLHAVDFSVADHLAQVDALLTHTTDELSDAWSSLADNAGSVDILHSSDLPMLLSELASNGGKRLRPVLCALGWVAAGGRSRSSGQADVVRISAALELLHVFALVHDDVMDESASRRGRPTIHVQAEQMHRLGSGRGSGARFGESIAILVGDLAHAEASHLVSGLPAPLRVIWRLLVTELVAGQRRDLVGSAAGRRDLDFARTVARMKSGRYTVERPLELGAAAAGATRDTMSSLAAYGRAVGEAFALRDDLLGITGDPELTGKPAGDDLVSGKPTVILAIAQRRLRHSGARAALRRAGSAEFTEADRILLLDQFEADGICLEVERMIGDLVATAETALDSPGLDPDGVAQLTGMAHSIAWRDR